jgi:hypothetical protein
MILSIANLTIDPCFTESRTPAQVAGPWFLGHAIAGRFFLVALWRNSNLFPGVLVCVVFLYSGLSPSLVYSFFYLNEMTHSSLV